MYSLDFNAISCSDCSRAAEEMRTYKQTILDAKNELNWLNRYEKIKGVFTASLQYLSYALAAAAVGSAIAACVVQQPAWLAVSLSLAVGALVQRLLLRVLADQEDNALQGVNQRISGTEDLIDSLEKQIQNLIDVPHSHDGGTIQIRS